VRVYLGWAKPKWLIYRLNFLWGMDIFHTIVEGLLYTSPGGHIEGVCPEGPVPLQRPDADSLNERISPTVSCKSDPIMVFGIGNTNL
jgi:hypothetical protein